MNNKIESESDSDNFIIFFFNNFKLIEDCMKKNINMNRTLLKCPFFFKLPLITTRKMQQSKI